MQWDESKQELIFVDLGKAWAFGKIKASNGTRGAIGMLTGLSQPTFGKWKSIFVFGCSWRFVSLLFAFIFWGFRGLVINKIFLFFGVFKIILSRFKRFFSVHCRCGSFFFYICFKSTKNSKKCLILKKKLIGSG